MAPLADPNAKSKYPWLNKVMGSLVNKLTGSGMTGAEKEAYDLNVAETMRQEQRQEDFFNQYQSIGAQTRQMKEAGLNPALMQHGAVSPVSGPSATPASASPGGDPFQSILGIIQGVRGLRYEAETHKAQIENINADTRLKTANASGKEFENMNAADLLALDKREREARISKIFSGIDVDAANIALAEANTNLSETEQRYKEVLTALQDIEALYREPILKAQQAKLNAETHYIQYKQELDDARLLLDNANSEAERERIGKQVELLEQQIETAKTENKYADESLQVALDTAKSSARYERNKTALGYIGETSKALGVIAGSIKLFGTSPKNGLVGMGKGAMDAYRAKSRFSRK